MLQSSFTVIKYDTVTVDMYYCKLYFGTGTQLILEGELLGIEKSFSEMTRMGFEPRTFSMTPNRQH